MTVARLQTATTLREFCGAVADEVRGLTGLDRVVVHKFHADGHGEVFAESRRDDLVPWLGTHWPTEDLPKPARDMFKQIWVRPLPDVSGGLAELVPLVNPDTSRPLDMTHCALRGPSVMCTEYLRNMGVAATLVRQRDGLWGLIGGHHSAGPKAVPHPVRAACEFVAQVASLRLKAAEDREHFVYRLKLEGVHQQLVAAAASGGELAALTAGPPTLPDGMDAGGAAVFYAGRWLLVGATPTEAELEPLAARLVGRPEFASPTRPVFATDALAADYPAGAAFAGAASGLLAVPLSRDRGSLMLWFRPETVRTINWRGDPGEPKQIALGPHGPRLTGRRSFELFVESVRGRSLLWKAVELDSAARLLVMVMELVVGRAERQADLNAVLAEAVEAVGSRLGDAGAEVAAPRPLPLTRCDPVRVREVFVNLLSNALKYNDAPAKRVEVGWVAPGEDHPRPGLPAEFAGQAVYHVSDNGIGVSPRHIGQVFKMFKRLHGRDNYGGGTGAGLSIVKRLVERHRGRVWLDSTPGRGTTFYFTLPCEGG